MKNLLTILLMMTSLMTFAQGEEYLISMKRQIDATYESKSESEIADLIEKFSVSKDQAPEDWLPSYYLAYANVKLADLKNDDVEAELYYNNAINAISNSMDQWNEEAELMVLLADIYMRLGQIMGEEEIITNYEIASTLIESAISIDETNPRAYYLLGKITFDLNYMNGDPTDEACNYFAEAEDRFQGAKPASELHPAWGAKENARLKARCNQPPKPEGDAERK